MRRFDLSRRHLLKGSAMAAIGSPVAHNFPFHAPLTIPRWSNDFDVEPDPDFQLTAHENETIAAVTDVIVPGAKDAGAGDYIRLHVEDSFAERVYAANHDPQTPVWIDLPLAKKKGWQREIQRLQRLYRRGVEYVDCLSITQYGQAFVDLSRNRQESILREMDATAGPAGVPAQAVKDETGQALSDPCAAGDPEVYDFFDAIFFHTIEGLYADPVYGGNKNRKGWAIVGFPGPADGLPGAKTGYTDEEIGGPP